MDTINEEHHDGSEYKGMKGAITKSPLAIAFAGVVFLVIVLLGECTPLGELIPSNGITRTDVPKYRVHVLSAPVLEKLQNKLSNMNITAELEQLGNSNVFRAHDEQSHHAYFRLDEKCDFDEVKVGTNGEFPGGITAPPYFAIRQETTGIVVLQNDVQTASITNEQIDSAFRQSLEEPAAQSPGQSHSQSTQEDAGNSIGSPHAGLDLQKCPPLTINYGNSAVVYATNTNQANCFLIDNFKQPTIKAVPQVKNILQACADRYGKQFFALTSSPDKSSSQIRLLGVNFDGETPKLVRFNTPVSPETTIFHCGPARSLALLDKEKLSIIDAGDGRSIATHYFSDFKIKNFQPSAIQSFLIIPGVPAAIFGDKLIDMRSGEIVDTLYGYCDKSVFVVDFNNKKLYYSAPQTGSKDLSLMSINVYDLHEVNFQFQVTLAKRSLVEDEHVERHDYIKRLFLNQDGKLIGLSAPDTAKSP